MWFMLPFRLGLIAHLHAVAVLASANKGYNERQNETKGKEKEKW